MLLYKYDLIPEDSRNILAHTPQIALPLLLTRRTSFNTQNLSLVKSQKTKVFNEKSMVKECYRVIEPSPESAKERKTVLLENSDTRLGLHNMDFESQKLENWSDKRVKTVHINRLLTFFKLLSETKTLNP